MAQLDDLHAVVWIQRGEASRVGPDRIRLLAAIAKNGSISSAARSIGLTYRAAWNAVQALNDLFPRPLVVGQTGGRQGGGAIVTPAGLVVIAGFEKLEARLTLLMTELDEGFSGHGDLSAGLIWSLGMKTSARNALRGTVEHVTDGAVNCEVTLRISPAVAIVAVVTRQSAEELELKAGRDAIALIKSSFVILAPGEAPLRTSARNRLVGTVTHHETGVVNDEIVLELDVGKTLVATITRGSGEALGFSVGDRAQALIKASHVILAVD